MHSTPEVPVPAPVAPAEPPPELSGPTADDGADNVVTLTFDWHAHRFRARLDRRSVGDSRLEIACDLGPIPFSAEGVERRLSIFAVLDATRSGAAIRTTVSRKQRVSLIAEAVLAAPVTTNVLVTGIVTLLAQAKPYLDILALLRQPRRLNSTAAARTPAPGR